MSSLNRLRLITFDVTNTLLQFRASPGKHFGVIGSLFGVHCDNSDLVKSYKSNWRKMNKAYPNFGRNMKMDYNEWWRELIAGTFADSGAKIPDAKLNDFASHLLDLYKTSSCWQHCNGSLDFLNYLHKQQQLAIGDSKQPFVLGIIANFDPRLDTLLKNMKINHYFKFALNSYECNAEKPSKEIYEMALSAAELKDLKPEECLHIGDGPTTDYLAAKVLGWNAALVHEKSSKYLIEKYGTNIEEQYVFASLFDFHKKLLNNSVSWK